MSNNIDSLSQYKLIDVIDEDHNVYLVKSTADNMVYIKKYIQKYNLQIFSYIMNHPIAGIPRIYYCKEQEDKLVVIEEYIEGNTLEQILEKRGCLYPGEVTNYVSQLCDILSSLHALTPPIIHRDIKPSNVMLSKEGNIYLLDLNAARIDNATKSEDTELLGTHGYAAPEQYGFGSSDIRTDIYSTGILINTLISGSVSHTPENNNKFTDVIAKCIQMDPANRYQSVAELKEAILLANSGKKAIANQQNTNPNETNSASTHKYYKVTRFFPPGFRELNPLHMIASSIVYFFTYAAVINMKLDNFPPKTHMPTQIILATMFTLMFVFTGNYLGVQKIYPHFIRRHKVLMSIAIIITDLLLFVLAIFADIVVIRLIG